MGGSRSPTDTGPVLSPFVRSVATRSHRAPHPKVAIPALGPWDRPGLQDRLEVPELCRDGLAGGKRGLPGGAVRGYQLVCYPCQEGYHYAEGYPAGSQNQGGEGVVWFYYMRVGM